MLYSHSIKKRLRSVATLVASMFLVSGVLSAPAVAADTTPPQLDVPVLRTDGYTFDFEVSEGLAAQESPVGLFLKVRTVPGQDPIDVPLTIQPVDEGDTTIVAIADEAILSSYPSVELYYTPDPASNVYGANLINLYDLAGNKMLGVPGAGTVYFGNAPETDPGPPASSDSSSDSSASDSSADVVRAAPYAGPVVHPLASSAASGGKATLSGSNLRGVTAVSIDGLEAGVTVNSDGEIEITVPAGLAAGTYDLVITSDSGNLTVQDGITISGSATSGNASGSTKRLVDDTAKVWVFDVAGAGKVQIFVNGEEIAWVRTDDPNDAKLKDGYLVRTVELVDGKNVIEIYVDGERVRRTAYTK